MLLNEFPCNDIIVMIDFFKKCFYFSQIKILPLYGNFLQFLLLVLEVSLLEKTKSLGTVAR